MSATRRVFRRAGPPLPPVTRPAAGCGRCRGREGVQPGAGGGAGVRAAEVADVAVGTGVAEVTGVTDVAVKAGVRAVRATCAVWPSAKAAAPGARAAPTT